MGNNELMMMPAASIDMVIERRNMMVDFVRRAMTQNTDYGMIPGTQKNTLLKPGAEKLNTLFGLTPRFVEIKTVEDWGGTEHNGEPFFYYWQKCQLLRDGVVVGEGDGSCNSWEKKYRYRASQRVCPNCGKATIFKSKNQGEGFYCWAKKDGCGARFEENAPSIVSQEAGQVVNPEIADQVNTLLKMAQKRALIAATLLAVNASEFFTQDMDDMYIDATYREVKEEQPKPEPVRSGIPETKLPPPVSIPSHGNGATRETFFALATEKHLNTEAAKTASKYAKSQDWTTATAELMEHAKAFVN
jgi:predicted RNA-binding Zn-ribbon protein involved in translation (DUF1610 family)